MGYVGFSRFDAFAMYLLFVCLVLLCFCLYVADCCFDDLLLNLFSDRLCVKGVAACLLSYGCLLCLNWLWHGYYLLVLCYC